MLGAEHLFPDRERARTAASPPRARPGPAAGWRDC
jgi:hypothetical protein